MPPTPRRPERRRYALALAMALSGPLLAARTRVDGEALATVPAELAPLPAPLARSLAAVRPQALAADAAFLAADELEGRATPSEGLEVAARFLVSRVERLGFQPGAAGGWRHEFVLHRQRIDPDRSRVVLRSERGERGLDLGGGYHLERVSQLAEVEVEGALVSVGEASRDELEAAQLAGRWALSLEGHRSPARTARRVAALGGLGLVLVPAPDDEDARSGMRYANAMRTVLEGVLSYPSEHERTSPETPVIALDGLGARALAELAGPAWHAPVPPAGTALDVRLHEVRALADPELRVANVCAFWPGTDIGDETLVVSAHYDHVGADQAGEVYNGADDNASGCATLLAVAEGLAARGPLRRSVLLLWLSGEEHGLWGSRAWVSEPWLPGGARAVADLNIDMVGRNAPDELYLTPTAEHPSSNALALVCARLAPEEHFPELRSQDEHWRRSDHRSFAETLRVPVAFLSSGDHEDYHRPSDTAEKLDADKMARVARLVLRVLDAADGLELPPLHDEH